MGPHLAGDQLPVSQSSVLRLVLSNRDAGCEHAIRKFYDNTKLGAAVETFEGQKVLLSDLHTLEYRDEI